MYQHLFCAQTSSFSVKKPRKNTRTGQKFIAAQLDSGLRAGFFADTLADGASSQIVQPDLEGQPGV